MERGTHTGPCVLAGLKIVQGTHAGVAPSRRTASCGRDPCWKSSWITAACGRTHTGEVHEGLFPLQKGKSVKNHWEVDWLVGRLNSKCCIQSLECHCFLECIRIYCRAQGTRVTACGSRWCHLNSASGTIGSCKKETHSLPKLYIWSADRYLKLPQCPVTVIHVFLLFLTLGSGSAGLDTFSEGTH